MRKIYKTYKKITRTITLCSFYCFAKIIEYIHVKELEKEEKRRCKISSKVIGDTRKYNSKFGSVYYGVILDSYVRIDNHEKEEIFINRFYTWRFLNSRVIKSGYFSFTEQDSKSAKILLIEKDYNLLVAKQYGRL